MLISVYRIKNNEVLLGGSINFRTCTKEMANIHQISICDYHIISCPEEVMEKNLKYCNLVNRLH